MGTTSPKSPALLNASSMERYGNMEPSEFRDYVSGKWNAAESVVDLVAKHVEEGQITPIEGARSVACVTAEILGYKELHGTLFNTPPIDLLQAFRGGTFGRSADV